MKKIPMMLLLSLGVAILMAGLFAARDGHAALPSFVGNTLIGMLYAVNIGLPAHLIFGRLHRWFVGRNDLFAWAVYISVVMGVTVVGNLVTNLVLVVIGVLERDDLATAYLHSLFISGIVAVPATIGAFTYGQLQGRIARASKLAVEARLASLESRVRPHFLFNALNSAIALIPEDPKRAEKVLERLAHLLRFSLDTAATVTLGDELTIVKDYLEIEQVRFGDRLRFDIAVPDELLGVRVPAFAVQTLVENSVKYAVSVRKAGACISVRARADGDRLRLDVSDDGPGFTGPIWLPGHGLDGLRSRLDAVYGPSAKLVVPAHDRTGAAICIELPAVAS